MILVAVAVGCCNCCFPRDSHCVVVVVVAVAVAFATLPVAGETLGVAAQPPSLPHRRGRQVVVAVAIATDLGPDRGCLRRGHPRPVGSILQRL